MKLGRPELDEVREKLRSITFRVDPETERELKELEKTIGKDIRGRRSIVLRRIIHEAYQNAHTRKNLPKTKS